MAERHASSALQMGEPEPSTYIYTLRDSLLPADILDALWSAPLAFVVLIYKIAADITSWVLNV